MLNLTDEQKRLFYTGGNFKDYVLSFPEIDFTITNETIHQESVTINEAICEDDDFTLGGCIASSMQFEVSEIVDVDLSGLEFTAEMKVNLREDGTCDLNIPMGVYRVDTARRVDDKDYKRVVAYDRLYDASIDVSEWYKVYFVDKTKHTVKETREALLRHLGIDFADQNLMNDDVVLQKTSEPTKGSLSGTDMLRQLCVINGGFGRMNREGIFEVTYTGNTALFPEETLYPSEDLYPEDSFAYIGASDENNQTPDYRTVNYEEYITQKITCLYIQTEDELAQIGIDTSNPYIISNNTLLYGKKLEELNAIGQNIFKRINSIEYRPNTTELTGLPYIEAGDAFGLIKRRDTIESFVFSRTLSGIQALKDTFEARGNEIRANELSITERVDQLQGQADATEEELEDFQIETEVKLEVLEDSIYAKVAESGQDWDTSGYTISFFGYGEPYIEYENLKDGDYYLDQDTGKIYQFNLGGVTPDYTGEGVPDYNYAYENGVRNGQTYFDTSEMTLYRFTTDPKYPIKYYSAGEPEEKYPITFSRDINNAKVGDICVDYYTGDLYKYISEIYYIHRVDKTIYYWQKVGNANSWWKVTTGGWTFVKQCELVAAQLQAQINITSDAITAEVSRATSAENSLSSRITITAGEISSEVTRAQNAESSLSSRITQTESNISLKVSKGDVVSEINQSADTITLSAGRLVITTGDFTIDRYGDVRVKGEIEADSGYFGDWHLGSGAYGGMYAGDTQDPNSISPGMWLGSTGIRFINSSSNYFNVSSSGVRTTDIIPTVSQTYDLGSSLSKWNNVYVQNSAIETSDRALKENIEDISEEQALLLINGVVPKTYRMKNGTSGRTHWGIMSNDIESLLLEMGMSGKDFAGFVKFKNEDGTDGYGLRYSEFIAPIIKYCQYLNGEIIKLKTESEGKSW